MTHRCLQRVKGCLLAPLVLALSACGGAASSTESGAPPGAAAVALAEQIKALEASGQLPKLDRSADIRGPDNDNNGIRDDIDAWLAAQPISDEEKRGAQQMARPFLCQQRHVLLPS